MTSLQLTKNLYNYREAHNYTQEKSVSISTSHVRLIRITRLGNVILMLDFWLSFLNYTESHLTN